MTEDAAVERSENRAGPSGRPAPTIVAGLDGSPTSWDAFSWAAGEAIRTNAKLIVVYVMPVADPAAVYGAPYDYGGAANVREEVADELKDEVERRARDLGVSISFVTDYGDAPQTLTEIARTVHANLVVVGRSAKAWHHLTGSLGHRLSCRKDAPVVVVVP
jgi:nucleotide-binding universal stress UspA family protein